MVSLIDTFNEIQKDIVIERILRQCLLTGFSLSNFENTYSCFIFKRRLVTVILHKKRFIVQVKGKKYSHWGVFSYKTSAYNICKFTEGIKKFLEIMLNDSKTVKEERVKNTFRNVSNFKGSDIAELKTNELLIVEEKAVNSWFENMPVIISYV